MKRRVFVAINLPEDIKKELAGYQKKWPELPVKWVKPENLHITLDFLGYVSDEELLNVFQSVRDLASKYRPFEVRLKRLSYGPPQKMPPRMIWATGEKIKELNLLPHVTLGRIRAWEWKKIEPEERPEVDEETDLSFEVNSFEVMESQLKRGGPEYTILESFSLK